MANKSKVTSLNPALSNDFGMLLSTFSIVSLEK